MRVAEDSSGSITPDVDIEALDRLFHLKGKRVFIPGGYDAIGEAIAPGFARHGARVVIAGPSKSKAARLGCGGEAAALAVHARSIAGPRSGVAPSSMRGFRGPDGS